MSGRSSPSRLARARIIAWAAFGLAGFSPVSSPAQAPSTDPVVMLPPLTVSDRGAPLKWRYLAMPGLEILSVCDDSDSEAFAQRVRRLDDLLRFILPVRFMARTSVPESTILLDAKTGQARSREVLADVAQKNQSRVKFMPNLRVVDLDATGVFAIIQPNRGDSFTYAPDRIAFLLERRVPRLPDWFIEGTLGFYQQLELRERDIEVRHADWLSEEETLALTTEPEHPRTLLPLEEMFARRRRKVEDPDELTQVWRAQCALFVRWALVKNAGKHREALWKFVDALETAPPSETLFREHFGLGFSDLRDALSDYLPEAVQERTSLPVPPTPRQRLRFRAATELEVARIRGDWERMEIAYVRARTPAYLDKYVEQARRTLGRPHERGENDPRLLAALGLTEIDLDDFAAARPLLEAATAANVVRPRAYYELARLRYQAFIDQAPPETKLTPSQTAEILGPLFAARRQQPPLAPAFVLLTTVLARSEAPPTAEQLAFLHESARNFPQVSELMFWAIYFHIAAEQPSAATTLLELALVHATDPAMREKLERLQTSLPPTKK